MAVDFNALYSYPNAGQAFSQSFQQGMQQGRQDAARNAMAVLVQDPNNPRALAALAKVDPESAMQFRTQQATLAKQQLSEHQDNIIKGAEIVRQFMPKDQASYSAALQAAQQAGIDISQVPQQYNQQYVEGIVKIADAMKPQPEGDPNQVIVTPQQGMPAFVYDKQTHQSRMLFAPNPGNQAVGAPAGPRTATNPQTGERVQFNPQSGQWEPMGGPTPQTSGGFPGPN
jgi:hypothetical protein